MESITQENIDFENEPELKKFLSKKEVFGLGGIDAELLRVSKEVKKSSRTEKEYITYTLLVKLDEFTEYEINNVFRTELTWGKVKTPKNIHISVIKSGAYFNWKIDKNE